ncbi:MAG: hypothetical protein SH857_10955 [Chitinophagales bacterium]|nr:hypothetical protein [Chitinophagales bacterium]
MKSIRFIYLLLLCTAVAQTQTITMSEWQQLVPSDLLPAEVKTRNSNNNLDVALFNGRYYLAFRTAPTHFASRKTKMYIVSSADLQTWQFEQEIEHGYDLREPRFLVHDGKLFFYYFEGGKNPFGFEPRHVWMKEYQPATGWKASHNIGLDGFVPWRFRTRNDTIYLSAYYGKNLYSAGHQADLRLFTSTNGYQWNPLTDHAQCIAENAEEGEFIFDKQGNLWGTVRLESQGALIVTADHDDLGNWCTNSTKYKYDSALMFAQGDDIYVVSRRNVDGEMAKAPEKLGQNTKEKYNLIRYWLTTKKTALFKLNKDNMELEHLLDFPSTGDTAFPGIAQIDERTFLLLNYSSNIQDKNRNWFSGQVGKTYIYWTILKLDGS